MLEPILGSKNKERILLYLHVRKEGYAREISRYFKTDLAPVQKQLERLENGGVLYGRAADDGCIVRRCMRGDLFG